LNVRLERVAVIVSALQTAVMMTMTNKQKCKLNSNKQINSATIVHSKENYVL